ncbi:MAG: extracellular solute-binding protein [Lachnospiraceae bacterium]|nr:extracellular solute-binding protein [Lachnospiraceae bacterium]MCI9135583.1 extracellular solute-binding protein [Lachnospiraceae bacterium]
MGKKLLAVILSAAMTAAVLAGCGNSGEKPEEPVNKEGETGKQITLSVFDAHAYGLDEYDEMDQKFEEEHPGVITEVQHASNDAPALLQSRVNAGDIPDVFAVESGTTAKMYYEYAYDWTEDTDILEMFHADALERGRDEDGRIKSLPWVYENMGILYNQECFEKAGITELPANMEEMEAACKKLEDAGITAFALPAKETWALCQLATHFMLDKSLDAQGTNEALKNGDITFAELQNWKNLFKLLDLAVEYGPDKPLEIDWETSENMLANGDASMIHMGDWCQATLDSFNPDARLAFLPVPVGETQEDATILSSSNWTYLVNKDSENLELAKEYVKYILTSDMGQYWMCEGVGLVPGVKTDQEIKGALANDASSYIAQGRTNGWIHSIAPTGYIETCGSYLQAYMLGEMSAEEVTQAFQDFWTTGQ